MVTVPIKRATIDYDYSELDGFKLTIEVGSGYTHSANMIKKLIESGNELEFSIKKPTADKSQKQVAMAWAVMREMAKALEVPTEEIYRKMIRLYGKATFMKVPTVEADRIIALHEADSDNHGNFGEIMGTARDDSECSIIKLYWGCSGYNNEEMSQFLDGIDSEHAEMFGDV